METIETTNTVMTFITTNWEWILLAVFIIEKAIKISPSKKDDLIWDGIIKPLYTSLSGKIKTAKTEEKKK